MPSASNCCLPGDAPVVCTIPPVPSCTRGERCDLDGRAGRINAGKSILTYGSGKMAVVRNDLLTLVGGGHDAAAAKPEPVLPSHVDGGRQAKTASVLVYRAHAYPVTTCRLSATGAYCASADSRGVLRVWAFDHEEHLTKYEAAPIITGACRDLDWCSEGKRLVITGERAGEAAGQPCSKVIDGLGGNSMGTLAQHMKGRATSAAMKPNRPFRLVTGGKDDAKLYWHAGPPFQKIIAKEEAADGTAKVPCEAAHDIKGGVHCVRYNSAGTVVVSVGGDRCLATYDGKTGAFLTKMEKLHTATIYAVAWSRDDQHVVTASGDGCCHLIAVSADGKTLTKQHTWQVAEHQLGRPITKDFAPVGGVQVGCAFAGPSNTPVSVGLNGQLSILPMPGTHDDANAIGVITGHYAAVAGMAVDTKSKVFYTGDTDGIICQFDLATCRPKSRVLPPDGSNDDLMYVVHKGAIAGLGVLPGTGTLLSVGWDDKLIATPRASSGPPQASGNVIGLGAQPSAIATGNKVAVIATVQGLVVVKDEDGTGDKVTASELMTLPYTAQAVEVSPDDATVYVGGDDCHVHIYTCDSGSLTLTEKHVITDGHLKPVHALRLSNDRTKLASADTRDICVFDVTSDSYAPVVAKGRWCFHVQRITSLTWSADDAMIASGGADDAIYVWCLDNPMKRIHYPYAHRGGVTAVHFSTTAGGDDAARQILVSVGVDSVIHQWDVTDDVKTKFG